MGNGGLCGGRGDNKASNTSEASPLPQSNQRYANHEKSTLVPDIVFRPSKVNETYCIVVFNFSDQGTSRQTENFRNYLTEMSGKGSSTLNCDICNTKFGFLTRKVIKMIRN